MPNNKAAGNAAESLVMRKLRAAGFRVERPDDYFDLLLNGTVRVEVKSCALSVRYKKSPAWGGQWRVGRFDFTEEHNRTCQRENGVWVCFVVRILGKPHIIGFVKASDLPERRYITLHDLNDAGPLDVKTFRRRCKIP